MPSDPTVLAVLFSVIATVLGIAWKIFDRMFKQAEESFKFAREQAEKSDLRQADQLQAWIDNNREQSEKADARQAAQLTAWIDAHKEQIVVGAAQAEALGRIQQTQVEIQQTQVEIQKTQVEIYATLQRLNGKGG